MENVEKSIDDRCKALGEHGIGMMDKYDIYVEERLKTFLNEKENNYFVIFCKCFSDAFMMERIEYSFKFGGKNK